MAEAGTRTGRFIRDSFGSLYYKPEFSPVPLGRAPPGFSRNVDGAWKDTPLRGHAEFMRDPPDLSSLLTSKVMFRLPALLTRYRDRTRQIRQLDTAQWAFW